MTQFGSFQNMIAANAATRVQPTVGMPATIVLWTDREPATVVYVSPSGKTVRVRECHARRTDSNGMSDDQSYHFEENLAGRLREFRLCKAGWRAVGSGGKGAALRLGTREKYHDFSF